MEDDVPGIEVRPFDSVNAPLLAIKMTASQLNATGGTKYCRIG